MTEQEIELLLPEISYTYVQSTQEIGIITRGDVGYIPTTKVSPEHAIEIVDEMNAMLGITKAQASAMSAGSLFGWGVPAADPRNYDEKGLPKRQNAPVKTAIVAPEKPKRRREPQR